MNSRKELFTIVNFRPFTHLLHFEYSNTLLDLSVLQPHTEHVKYIKVDVIELVGPLLPVDEEELSVEVVIVEGEVVDGDGVADDMGLF